MSKYTPVVHESDPAFDPTATRLANFYPTALEHERGKVAAKKDRRSFSDYMVGLIRRDLIARGLLKEGEGK